MTKCPLLYLLRYSLCFPTPQMSAHPSLLLQNCDVAPAFTDPL